MGVLIDGVTEIVKYAALAVSLAKPVSSSALKGISGRVVRRAGRTYRNKNF